MPHDQMLFFKLALNLAIDFSSFINYLCKNLKMTIDLKCQIDLLCRFFLRDKFVARNSNLFLIGALFVLVEQRLVIAKSFKIVLFGQASKCLFYECSSLS